MPQGSAIPAWLGEILPAGLKARPALTEALWAGLVAFTKTTLTVLYALWVSYSALGHLKGFEVTFAGYLHVIQTGWFAVAAPIVWSAYNGQVAHAKASAAESP